MSHFRVGIAGGMGPLAGVELQRLIIEMTPAQTDQEHLQVVCFTNPQIPDRTLSLKEDDGQAYVQALGASLGLLERCEVHTAVIPCNTAHARLATLQKMVTFPLLDMVQLTKRHLRAAHFRSVVLLATEGTLQAQVYDHPAIQWIVPDRAEQAKVNEVIRLAKSGQLEVAQKILLLVVQNQVKQGAKALLLACTELSLFYPQLTVDGYLVIDPLRLVAAELVHQSQTYSLGSATTPYGQVFAPVRTAQAESPQE